MAFRSQYCAVAFVRDEAALLGGPNGQLECERNLRLWIDHFGGCKVLSAGTLFAPIRGSIGRPGVPGQDPLAQKIAGGLPGELGPD